MFAPGFVTGEIIQAIGEVPVMIIGLLAFATHSVSDVTSCRLVAIGVVRDSNSAQQPLSSPANWYLMFASWNTGVTTNQLMDPIPVWQRAWLLIEIRSARSPSLWPGTAAGTSGRR